LGLNNIPGGDDLIWRQVGRVAFEPLAFVVNSAPQIASFAVNFHKYFAQAPTSLARFHRDEPLFSDPGCKDRAKPMPPKPNGFMADVSAAFMQQFLDISRRKWEPDVRNHRQAEDLG